MKTSRNHLATLVSRLGLAVALAVTIVVPVVNFVDVYYELHHELAFTAQLKANRLGK